MGGIPTIKVVEIGSGGIKKVSGLWPSKAQSTLPENTSSLAPTPSPFFSGTNSLSFLLEEF